MNGGESGIQTHINRANRMNIGVSRYLLVN